MTGQDSLSSSQLTDLNVSSHPSNIFSDPFIDASKPPTQRFTGSGAAADANIVFIDTAVTDYDQLAAGVVPGDKVVLLDPKQDEIGQISQFLAHERGWKASTSCLMVVPVACSWATPNSIKIT